MDENNLPPEVAFVGIRTIGEQMAQLANLYRSPLQTLSQTLGVFGSQMRTLQMTTNPTLGLLNGLVAALPRIDPSLYMGDFDSIAKVAQVIAGSNLGIGSATLSFLSSMKAIQSNPDLQATLGFSDFAVSQPQIFNSVAKLSTLMASDAFIAAQSGLKSEIGFQAVTTNFLQSLVHIHETGCAKEAMNLALSA